jgi:hypothetical protein
MNGTVGRRVFVGSLAGAGVGALGATSLLDLPVAAQRAGGDPLTREIHRQLKEAFGKMQDGRSTGARQAASVLRVYASTVDDRQLQAVLRKANRQQLLLTEGNHGELVRLARELGIDPSRLPPHSTDRVGREAAFDRLVKEGLSPLMREAAEQIDALGEKMERLERRAGGPMAMQVALRQPIPDPVDCGDCEQVKGQMEAALYAATVACAAAAVFPPLVELCVAASGVYLGLYMTYAMCLAIVALCDAYYN